VWGQGLPPPLFQGRFRVDGQRLVGEKHLKLMLSGGGLAGEGLLFNQDSPLPDLIQATYRLEVNEWNGRQSLQFQVEHWADAGDT
jgi:single-stranded-DNA-specific exonuclease